MSTVAMVVFPLLTFFTVQALVPAQNKHRLALSGAAAVVVIHVLLIFYLLVAIREGPAVTKEKHRTE